MNSESTLALKPGPEDLSTFDSAKAEIRDAKEDADTIGSTPSPEAYAFIRTIERWQGSKLSYLL